MTREVKDKKGGGLMLLYKSNKDVEITKINTKNYYILFAKGKVLNTEFKIILVYFSAGNSQDDRCRDNTLRQDCENIMGNLKDEAFIVLGDFNGHIGFLGYQALDKKGEMIIEWMNNYGLTLLNAVDECEGL